MYKVREFFASKSIRPTLMFSALMVALASVACAEDATSATVTTAFQTGFQKMASDALNMIAIIVPIALGVAGVVFLSRKAISWFKSLAK